MREIFGWRTVVGLFAGMVVAVCFTLLLLWLTTYETALIASVALGMLGGIVGTLAGIEWHESRVK